MADIEAASIPLNDLNDRRRRIQAIFHRCDRDNDGYVCFRELYEYVNENNNEQFYVPKSKVRILKQQSDRDGDGRLNLNEFIDLMNRREFQDVMHRHVNRYIDFLVPPPEPQLLRVGRSLTATDGDEDDEKLIDKYTCCPPPTFFFIISIIEFACFIADESTEENSTLTGTGVTAKIFIFDPSKKTEVWRYLTYMLVHIGYGHLIMNLIVQLLLGVPLEMVHKWWRVMIIYFTGVIAGCLAHSITEPHAKLGGASGGVYAIIAAHVANVIMNWGQMIYPVVQLIVFGILVTADLVPAIYNRYVLGLPTSVGVSAHLGGAIAGLLVGIYTLRNLRITNTEKYIWWTALVLYFILMTVAIAINIIN